MSDHDAGQAVTRSNWWRGAAATALFALFLTTAPPAASAGTVDPFVFGADGEQEVPPVETAATGGCLGVLDAGVQFNIVCAHNVEGATSAHIHLGEPGVGGPIVFDLGDASTSPFSANWTDPSGEDVANLLAGDLYVNIHSTTHPKGEIRGQIVERTIDDFVFFPNGGQAVPPTGSEATGVCAGDLSDNATMLTVTCSHDVFGPTAAHVHRGAAGTNGPVLFDFGDPTSPFMGAFLLLPQDIAELAGRLLYVNIHSDSFPGGEIRGQMAAEQIFADGFESGDTSAWADSVP